eukprot:1195372-Prorocentrum_minimum.AAC.15
MTPSAKTFSLPTTTTRSSTPRCGTKSLGGRHVTDEIVCSRGKFTRNGGRLNHQSLFWSSLPPPGTLLAPSWHPPTPPSNPPLDPLFRKVLEACCLVPDLDQFEGGDLTEVGEKGITVRCDTMCCAARSDAC